MPVVRAAVVLLCALLLLPPSPVLAADDAFTVSGVPVDVTAADAAAARERAFVEGQRLAFRRLLERLVPSTEQGRLPEVADQDIEAMVRDVSVDSEKTSSVRYIASLTVRFKPEPVRALLSGKEIPFVDSRRQAVVVLPVLVTDRRTLLWDDPNPWRAAWANRRPGGLVPFLVPLGELEDVMAVSAEQAMARDPAALQAIAERHGTADVLVAVASVSEGAGGLPSVTVQTFPYGAAAYGGGRSYTVDGQPGESPEAVLNRAADAIAAAVAEEYKQGNVAAQGHPGQISALVPVQGFQDWLSVRRRLGRVANLRGYEVVSLSRSEAALILHFVGDQHQLEALMAQNGLGLTWGDGFWVLKAAEAADLGR